jgi:hypothetical protein
MSTSNVITNPHSHVLTVPVADLEDGADKTYDIQGTSQHTHTVTITAAQFATLAGGTSIMLTSTSGNGHTHAITVNCVTS